MRLLKVQQWGWVCALVITCGFWWGTAGPVFSQSDQVVEVTIKDSKFVTKQGLLRLGSPAVIKVRNEDTQRHDLVRPCLRPFPLRSKRTG